MAHRKATARIEQLSSQLDSSKHSGCHNSLRSEVQSLLDQNKYDEASKKALIAFLSPPKYKPQPSSLAILNKAQKKAIQFGTAQVQIYEWNPSSKTSIVLTHGFGTSAAFLAPVIERLLITTTSRIVTFDNPAHGESGGTHVSVGDTLEVLRSIIMRKLDAERTVKALIGHSMGATTTFMLLFKEPDLFSRQGIRPAFFALNPPLQPTTLIYGFCKQQKFPLELVDGMRSALRPSPEDVLRDRMGESGVAFKSLRVFVAQDEDDVVARPGDTAQLVEQLRSAEVKLEVKMTKGLGHFKIVGSPEVLEWIGTNCA